MKRRSWVCAGVVVLGALLLAGCSNGGHDGSEHEEPSAAVSAVSEADPDDVMFAQMMIPHHEQAVEMATLAEDRASDPFIAELAAEIRAAQQPEIDQMSAWLVEWGAPRQSQDEATAEHGGHGMSGMLSADQLAALSEAEGAEFDRLFAEGMIEHHEGAIEMASAVVDSSDPDVAVLARTIISAQEAEIVEMRGFLNESG